MGRRMLVNGRVLTGAELVAIIESRLPDIYAALRLIRKVPHGLEFELAPGVRMIFGYKRRSGEVSAAMRQKIIERDGHVCGLCGEAIEDPRDIHIDHVRPKSRGGRARPENLQVAHAWCNRSKGNRYDA
jgi:hypothetical protein